MNLIQAVIVISQSADISPELKEASPWLNDVVSVSNGMMNSGVDPGLALATIAAVPVVLKVLNMINQFTVAAIEDWKQAKALEREREKHKLELEIERERMALLNPPRATPAPGAPLSHPAGRRPTG
jgi:hypothetical protein